MSDRAARNESEPMTHFVRAGQVAIDLAVANRSPVTAACGRRWVPSGNRALADLYPLCAECLQAITEGWAA